MKLSSSILKELSDRLSHVRQRQDQIVFLSQFLTLCTGSITAAVVLCIVESAAHFSSGVRTGILLVFGSAIVLFGWRMAVRPFFRWLGWIPSTPEYETARSVGSFFPYLKDRLLNAYQLARAPESVSSLYSSELIHESLNNFIEEIRPLNFLQSVANRDLLRSRRWFLFSLLMCLAVVLVFPGSLSGAAYRLFHCTTDFIPPSNYRIDLMPGNREIVKGDNVEISIKITAVSSVLSPRNEELILFQQREGQENFDEIYLQPDSAGTAKTILQAIRSTTKYFARYADAESGQYTLAVLDRPLLRSFYARLEYPPYTRLPVKKLDEGMGDITAIRGTRVVISGASSKSLKEASIQLKDSIKIPCILRDEKFSASFSLQMHGSYSIALLDKEGLSNSEPVWYHLTPVEDEYPHVTIKEPGRNIDIAGDQSILLGLKATDDFGFSQMRLGFRLVKSRYVQPQTEYSYVPIPFSETREGQMEVVYSWNLGGMNLVPEDVVEYAAEVFDNDAVRGPKRTRSALYLLRLPSLDEVFADVHKEHERSIDELTQSREEIQKLKEEMESIDRDLKGNKNPDWQTKKKVEEIAQRYQDVQKKLDDIQARLGQMTEHMQQQNVLSKETMEKYTELQQLLQQLDSAELQKALQQLQQKMPSISKEQLRQALQTMNFSEERFRQGVERTINLLKRIQIEQKVDEVRKRAQEVEQAEQALHEESTQASGDSPKQKEISKKQHDLAEKEQALEQEAAGLQQRMEEFFTEMPADKMKASLEQLQQQNIGQMMQQAAQEMQQGNMQSAQQTQSHISSQLQRFRRNMDAVQQQMLQQQSQYTMNEMRKAISNILELSKNQETLKQQSNELPLNSPQLRQNAQEQQQIEMDLRNVVNGLDALSQKSFVVTPEMGKTIGEALGYMKSAMRMLDYRNGSSASQEQAKAMTSLNQAAAQVQDALQTLMQGGNGAGAGGSLLQQLQMMAGKQMALNMQTQQAGNGLTGQQAADAERLAGEQSAIRKSLEELQREAQQSGEQQRLMGDIKKITEEMEEVARNLEQNKINPETIQKQERILSRLLDASKSMRERDYEKKRKSETGTPHVLRSPGELDGNSLEGGNKLREELLKALEQGYSRDYQELIRKYFEELEKTERSAQEE